MTCSEETAHEDRRSSEIRRGEKDLQTPITAFHNFINLIEDPGKICFAFLLADDPRLELRMTS